MQLNNSKSQEMPQEEKRERVDKKKKKRLQTGFLEGKRDMEKGVVEGGTESMSQQSARKRELRDRGRAHRI